MVSQEAWVEEYYSAVEHYFWSPRELNRWSPSPQLRKSAEKVIGKLRQNEVPLNHILKLFFALAPHGLVSRLFRHTFPEWPQEPLWTICRSDAQTGPLFALCQPDLLFEGAATRIAVEIKVSAKTSLEQMVKYALFLRDYPRPTSDATTPCFLLFIGKGDADCIWGGGLGSQTFRSALETFDLPSSVQKYARTRGDSVDAVRALAAALPVAYICYADLAHHLNDELIRLSSSEAQETLEALISGVMTELRSRQLL